MPPSANGRPTRTAITDLFDEERGILLVRYPVPLIVVIALSGVLAFFITGFFGYKGQSEPQVTQVVFQQAWVLFLWFCALMVVLQMSIFRDVSLRRRLIATLIVSLLAIAFIGVTYFNQSLPLILRQLLNQHRLLAIIASSPYTYAIVNFGLLAIFWVDTVRRWVRKAQGKVLSPSANIGIEEAHPENNAALQELISGDLLAGAVLSLVLAGLFSSLLLSNIIFYTNSAGVTQSVTQCMLSWPFGACPVGGTVIDPPTLSFLDIIQALIYLPLGLLLLALTATLSGFGAVDGVTNIALDPEVSAMRTDRRAGAVPIAEDVAGTVLTTLKSALDRRLRILLANLALSLRNVAWPALLFVAVLGMAQVATYIQQYLHNPKDFSSFVAFELPALGWAAAAVLSIVLSTALMLFSYHVAENTMRFLGLIGFIVLITFWIFSLALWGFNELMLQTHASARHPFDPPSWTTALSFAALLIVGFFILFVRRGRGGSPRARQAAYANVIQQEALRQDDPNATGKMAVPPDR